MCSHPIMKALFACLLAGSLAYAQDSPSGLDKQVHDLVRQLGDGAYQTRETARKTLVELGVKIIPILERFDGPVDLETKLRLQRIRYQIVGWTEDLQKHVAAIPAEPKTADLTPELAGVIAAYRPRSGDWLLKVIGDPASPWRRRAVHALVHSFPHLTAPQVDAFVRHALVLESRARHQFPRNVPAMIGMGYYCRYDWNGWPRQKDFELKTKTTHYLDNQPYGAPFEYRGPHATTGWIHTHDLSEGKHSYYFIVEYAFTHQGTRVQGQLRSADYSFETLPASAPDDLIASANSIVAQQVRNTLRFLDRDPTRDELFLGQDHMVDPWTPQVSWKEKGTKTAVRVPTWKVDQPLPVDLCFESEVLDLQSGITYPAEPVILKQGKSAYGYLCPRDIQTFARNRSGFIDVQVRLTPSRAQALTDPAVTSYFPGTITSGTLRMKITREQGPAQK